MNDPYPQMIESLPDIDVPMPGVRGKLLQANDHQVVFFDIEPVGEVPPHSHGDQWGVVLEGEMELVIDGKKRIYRPGDQYFIPAGAVHSATFRTHFRAIDVFADPDRYQPKAD